MSTYAERMFTRDICIDVPHGDPQIVRRASIWSMAIGVLLVLAGLYALLYFGYATVAATYVLGALLLAGGVFYAVNAFSARKWTIGLFDVLASVLYVIAGIVALRQPLVAAGVVTLILAVMYIFQGITRSVASVTLRPPQWGWMLFNGLVTLFLGFIIFAQWPASSLWLLGVLVGIDMLLSGWTMIISGMAIHRLTSKVVSAAPIAETRAV